MATVGEASGGVALAFSTKAGPAGSSVVALAASANLGPAGGSSTPSGNDLLLAAGGSLLLAAGGSLLLEG